MRGKNYGPDNFTIGLKFKQMTANVLSAGCAPTLPDWDHDMLISASGQDEPEAGDRPSPPPFRLNTYLITILHKVYTGEL